MSKDEHLCSSGNGIQFVSIKQKSKHTTKLDCVTGQTFYSVAMDLGDMKTYFVCSWQINGCSNKKCQRVEEATGLKK